MTYYIVTHETNDYEGSYTQVLGVFDNGLAAIDAAEAWTKKELERRVVSNGSCAKCHVHKGWHTDGEYWLKFVKEKGKKEAEHMAGHLFSTRCDSFTFGQIPNKLPDNEEVVVTPYELNQLSPPN
jgi:hypothetical protein